MSSKDNLALDLEHGVRRWDRARWISVFSSHNPTIREVTECLGLGLSASSSTTNRGIPKFDNPDYRKLSSEITKLSKDLPKEREALLDFAADSQSLETQLEELLGHYGPAIWGKDADRSCLLSPDATKKTYNKDLFYDNPEHKEILKVHLHRWIIIKACYYIRNMKLKRPSGASEYDTIAEFDGEGMAQSPHGTPLSLTPTERDVSAGAELEVKPVNFKKRKSSTRGSLSDGEEQAASPAKRPYSTLPISRTGSPRRSLKSLYPAGPGSIENIPPVPGHPPHMSPTSSIGAEPARIHLSPLASNELNGVARPPAPSQSPAAGGFIAVNSNSFTAANNSPPVREPSREAPRSMSKEPQQVSPALKHRDTPSYNSPYEATSRNSATPQNAIDARLLPPPSGTPGPAVHSPVLTSGPNGVGTREAPAVQPIQHAPGPQQPPPQAQPHHQPVQPVPSQAQYPAPVPIQAQVALPSHVLAQQPHVQAQQQPPQRPPSRTSTPSTHYSRSIAPHSNSRSSTPHAQVPSQPYIAPNTQVVPAPVVQSAPAYGLQLVATQQASPAPAPVTHVLPTHHVPPSQQYPVHHQPQPVLKSQPAEPAQIVQAPHVVSRPAVANTDLRLLQCEVTAGLFTFFYPRSSAPPDEPALLQRLHTLWYHGATLFERDLSPHYDLISKILTAWLHERQAITALRHSLAVQPGVSPAGLVDRLLAMNDLRVMRLKWKNMSTVDGLSPEDLLCMAFRVMTNTEGSEYLFKEGLERLNGGVFEFLRNEDAKIVMQRR